MAKFESVWSKGIDLPHFESLHNSINCDVLVIGGGMAGVLCAYYLKQNGVNCILAEADSIGRGITQNTTAVLTAQHDTLYVEHIKRFGEYKASQYLHANLEAVKKFRDLSNKIPCDFEQKPSIFFSQSDRQLVEQEVDAINKLGFGAEFVNDISLPYKISGGIKFPGQAQFHPLKFLAGIAQKLKIYEHTRVNKINGTTAITDTGNITASKIIVATHYPFINVHGLYPAKLYQERSYVIAIEGIESLPGTYEDIAEDGLYFRSYKDLLLIGGGDHRTGTKSSGFSNLRSFANRHYPKAQEKYAWANQDCKSLDGIPYIGQYCRSSPNIYVVSGFNLWGMTSSMVSANILTDMILGKKNEFEDVFCPQRSMIRKQLFSNMGAAIADFVFPTVKRCPHMGCALKWNKIEHTWDCPCHGSRFTEDGKLIDNPSMRDINVK